MIPNRFLCEQSVNNIKIDDLKKRKVFAAFRIDRCVY